jgi:ABC-type branched-subunit amino acid transport system substrate-binding protein
MKFSTKRFSMFFVFIAVLALVAYSPSVANAAKTAKVEKSDKMGQANAFFDANKMGDMSDFDPSNPIVPTGDTYKIAVVASFSGPASIVGTLFWFNVQWVAHDINKRGGIFVDGKKKLIEVIKADHMGKPDQCKKVVERMILQEKVNVLWGTDGSHLMKVINTTANQYKVIAINGATLADDLQDAANFSPYAFQTAFSNSQVGRGLAYYYGQIRKKEKKFYILCQDFGAGHDIAEGFKRGLKEYYPAAQIIGEDYHKLFITDFAPYLEKIKASGAEVIFTGDFPPDSMNLLKQARQMNIMLPIANNYMDNPDALHATGVEGTKGLVNINSWSVDNPHFKLPGHVKIEKIWTDLLKNKWKTPPYSQMKSFEHFAGYYGVWTQTLYWFLSVVERAKTADAEKIIALWENDTYKFVNGKVVKMRACDHKIIQDLAVSEFVPWEQQKDSYNLAPYYWFKGISFYGPTYVIPAEKVLPWMDQKLDRCKGKSDWGK